MTWAWIETSRAETGSSQTIISGLSARARAMPIRCRWPPGELMRVAVGVVGAQTDTCQQLRDTIGPFAARYIRRRR